MLISVAIVEDNPKFRDSFISLVNSAPDLQLHSVADDLCSGLALLHRAPADVLLVDLGLPDGSGLQIIAEAQKVWPHCDALVISVFGDMKNVLSAIQAGATGYLLKDSPADALVEQIRMVNSGGSAISPVIARQVLKLLVDIPAISSPMQNNTASRPTHSKLAQPEFANVLTPQESQVLRLANKGYDYEEVARLMGLSKHTVLTYVKRCYRKLHVNSKAGAIYEAQRLGIELG